MPPNDPIELRVTASLAPTSSARYHVLTELGRGGSGVISLALSRGIGGFNKLVVLKSIKEDLRGRERYAQMFLEEANLAARMNHPNVVQTYEVYRENGLPVIVMEYLDGLAFSTVCARAESDPRLNEATTITVLCKALAALHYAHELTDFSGRPLNLVHRDVTPHNILVTYQGQVKLIDFGIAKLSVSREQTVTGVIKGKLDYMPPEQLQGEAVDRRADIFAVGAMLWEGITRQPLWAGQRDADVMRHLLNGEIPTLRDVKPDVDPELEAICSKALAAQPTGRHETAAELQRDLERYLARNGGMVPESVLGKLVSESGADLRRQMQATIARSLEQLAANGEEPGKDAKRVLQSFRAQPQDPEDQTSSASTLVFSPPVSRKRRWRWSSGIASLALVALGSFLYVARPRPPSIEPKHAAAHRDPQAPAAVATARGVRIEVTVAPPEAKIFYDGLPVESNPFIALVPKDELSHSLRAIAPGYEPHVERLTLGADVKLDLTLVRATSAAGPVSNPPVASGLRLPAPPKRVRAPSKSCDPPYTIDASGIKRYRRECLPGDAPRPGRP